jgi:anthraniloyl-CoA monooxygenase
MTNVTPEGRITEGCAGMYDEVHVAAWSRITDFVHRHTPARIGIQLAHAGRKGSTLHPWTGRDEPLRERGWTTLGPSALPFDTDWPAPKAMDRSDMDAVKEAFVLATERAGRAGFDLVELHCAHGYLLSSFLSPAANQRRDAYGGSLENRMRYPLEVFDAVRAAWPKELPLSVRVSATDWLPEGDPGMTEEDAIVVARHLKEHGCDLIDVSTAGNTPRSKPVFGRMYQVPFADRIRHEVGIPTMAVGAILGADHANTILAAGRADLICMARPHLRDPYITLHAAEDYAYPDQWWPPQYLAGRPSHA